MTLLIDTLAYTNRLRRLPPDHKLLFAIALLILTLVASPPIQLLIALWLWLWIVVYAGIPARIYWKLLAIPAGFWLTSLPAWVISGVALAQIPQVQADIWQGFTLGPWFLYLSRQGMAQAGEVWARAIAATSCVYFMLLTIPFVEILHILRRLRCPVLLLDLLLLMYRFIFTLLRTAAELRTAQLSRNGYRTWKLSMHSLALLVGQLLQRTLIHYRQLSLSLESRGFNGEFRVWHSRHYVPSRRYGLEALIGCTVLLGLVGWSHVARV